MVDTFSCPLCSYVNENMGTLKNHIITVHKMDEWNWGLEVKVKFFCNTCDLEFSTKSMLRSHVQSGHNELVGIVVEDNSCKIVPDEEFITKNTKDMEEMLRNIPK